MAEFRLIKGAPYWRNIRYSNVPGLGINGNLDVTSAKKRSFCGSAKLGVRTGVKEGVGLIIHGRFSVAGFLEAPSIKQFSSTYHDHQLP